MAHQPVFKFAIAAGQYNVQPLFRTWVDRFDLIGVDVATLLAGTFDDIYNNFLVEAYGISPGPPVGSKHPSYPNCCCQDIRVYPKPATEGNMTDCAYADVTWIQARKINDTPVRSIQIRPFQQQEIRNFDNLGSRTRVPYHVDVPALAKFFHPDRIADIRVPRTMYHLRVSQYEDMSGRSLVDMMNLDTGDDGRSKQPLYNNGDWQGFPNSTMLWLGTCIDHQGIPIARVDYDFMTNDRGWNKFAAVYQQQNGFVPQDVQELPASLSDPRQDVSTLDTINGVGVFDMLGFADFDDMFPQLANLAFDDGSP